MKLKFKRLPDLLNLRKTEPDAALPDAAIARALHAIWENNRQWHHDGQEERDPQHGHMLRALLVAGATLAGVYDDDQSPGDAEVQMIIEQAQTGKDDASRAGVQMVLARALLAIYDADKDSRRFINKNAEILKEIAKDSEAFFQSDTSFLYDLHGCGEGRQGFAATSCV